jgi:hypothetical protein
VRPDIEDRPHPVRAGTPWAAVAFGWEAEALADVMAEHERQGWSRAQLLDELVRVCHGIADELRMEDYDGFPAFVVGVEDEP